MFEWFISHPKIQGLIAGGTIFSGANHFLDYLQYGYSFVATMIGMVLSCYMLANARLKYKLNKIEADKAEAENKRDQHVD